MRTLIVYGIAVLPVIAAFTFGYAAWRGQMSRWQMTFCAVFTGLVGFAWTSLWLLDLIRTWWP